MIAGIIIAIFVGVAIGIGTYCLGEIRGLREMIDLYESHVCDLIDEIQRSNYESNNN